VRDRIEAAILELTPGTVVVSGGAVGVDSMARCAAICFGLEVVVHEADWKNIGKSAGPRRNSRIVNDCDRVIAFWDGRSRGTLDTIEKACRAGKPVKLIWIETVATTPATSRLRAPAQPLAANNSKNILQGKLQESLACVENDSAISTSETQQKIHHSSNPERPETPRPQAAENHTGKRVETGLRPVKAANPLCADKPVPARTAPPTLPPSPSAPEPADPSRCPRCGARGACYTPHGLGVAHWQCSKCSSCWEACLSCGRVTTDLVAPRVCPSCGRDRRPAPIAPAFPDDRRDPVLVNQLGADAMAAFRSYQTEPEPLRRAA
jgi:hypothetical protein